MIDFELVPIFVYYCADICVYYYNMFIRKKYIMMFLHAGHADYFIPVISTLSIWCYYGRVMVYTVESYT